MFGKPEWFHDKTTGWLLTPSSWQGFVYSILWLVVLALPFWELFSLDRGPEALLWLVFGVLAFFADVRSIKKEIRSAAQGDVFVIDESTDVSELHTRHYDMHLRD